MVMPGRSYASSCGDYRFGFQGSEKDSEISGVDGGNITTYFREGDVRLAKWWSKDPLAAILPWQSPYSFMDNNPILYNDPYGDRVEKGNHSKEQWKALKKLKRTDKDFRKNVWKPAKAENRTIDFIEKDGIDASMRNPQRWDEIDNQIGSNEGGVDKDFLAYNPNFGSNPVTVNPKLSTQSIPTIGGSISNNIPNISPNMQFTTVPPTSIPSSRPIISPFSFAGGSPFTPNTSIFANPAIANTTIANAANAFISGSGVNVQIAINTPFTPAQLGGGVPSAALGGLTPNQLQWARGRSIMNSLIAMGVPASAFGSNWLIINPSQFTDLNSDGVHNAGEPVNTNASINMR
jgi:hypothetical protein